METTTTASLGNLPVELFLHVASYLSKSSLLSLRLANNDFRDLLHHIWLRVARQSTMSLCERVAIDRYTFEEDDVKRGRRKCLICGTHGLTTQFKSAAPICNAHQGRFTRWHVPENRSGWTLAQYERDAAREAVWVNVQRPFCVHEQKIVGWDVELCRCDCSDCGHFMVDCRVRVQLEDNKLSFCGAPRAMETLEGKHCLCV
ncbi:hypothetical protein DOTSEDRAFT_33506 [Dothistroma septosporum NZE10]|uniref:F-box domain-containing protein n=1 Tax=Dothistroma septosporum (strain NZE10 / CBS 128990) TaxID=675120 RepID=N1PR33_DOTSN|nr:hypothetical protein DOTSEDRAFT_33506 [Dothistroma septosporum NZE10]